MSEETEKAVIVTDDDLRQSGLPKDGAAAVLRSLLVYDPETGIFTWLPRPIRVGSERTDASWNGQYAGKTAGCKCKGGYWFISVYARRYYAHRLAWLWMTGAWPSPQVDHKNRKRADNRWDNLRECDGSSNAFNAKRRCDNTSGLKGAGHIKGTGRWRATIQARGRQFHLGRFGSKETAYEAYAKAAHELHGDFANIGEN